MRTFNSLLVLAVMCLAVFSCGKEEVETSSLSKTEMLVSNNWKISKMRVSQDNATPTDIYDIFYKDCEKDDLYKFNNDGSFELLVGPNLCEHQEGNQMGTWSFSGIQTKIILEDGVERDIVSLTETEFVTLKVQETYDPITRETSTYSKEITYTAQ